MVGPGSKVGNYVVREKLGEGGMGTVWMAEHPRIRSRVAIKVIRAAFAGDPEQVSRFFTEAAACSRIGHPSIVSITDFGETAEGECYYVMELLRGESLAARLGRGAMPIDEVRRLAGEVCDALAAAHTQGILHRDLKPDNVFLLEGEPARVKVLDFGLVKLLGSDEVKHRTESGALLGTPSYMSPEQCLSEPDLDARTDVYSMGVILYQMVTGELPFTGRGYGDVIMKHSIVPAPRARAARADCPEWLDALIDRALAKRRGERVQSMNALGRALRDGTAGEAGSAGGAGAGAGVAVGRRQLAHAPTVTPALARVGVGLGRRRWPAWLVVGVLLAAGAAAVWWWKRRPAPQRVVVVDAAVPAVDAAVRTPVDELLAAQHAALAGGDGDALAATYVPELFRIGTDASDVFTSRDAALGALRRALDGARTSGARLEATPARVLVGRAPGGRAAWITEELDWSSVNGGKTTRVRYLITQVAAEVGGRWRVIATHWARGLPRPRALSAAAEGKLATRDAIKPGAHALPGSDPAPVLEAARRALASRAALEAALAERPDVALLGSALGELAAGPAAARAYLRDLQGDFSLDRAPRAGASPDGEVGWAAADVTYTSSGGAKLPLRVLAVLLRVGTGYRVVQVQFSLGGPFPP